MTTGPNLEVDGCDECERLGAIVEGVRVLRREWAIGVNHGRELHLFEVVDALTLALSGRSK
jgi:hypothetical protein